jgi:tripartite-type tricarboxylate transporter receptor subunit TctC
MHPLAAQSKSEMLSNVPSFAESGYRTTILNTPLWLGLLGAARLPDELVILTLAALKSAYAEEELKAFFGVTKT